MLCDLPEKVFVTKKEILESNLGVTGYVLRKAVGCGALESERLPGCKNPRYRREEVLRVFGAEDHGA